MVDNVVFEAGNWAPFLTAGEKGTSWGNHRAVVVVGDVGPASSETVVATIPWRRHDPNPGAKAIVVLDATTNEPVKNAVALRVDNASGVVAFEANASSSLYHVYYMPWMTTGGPYPTVTYPASLSGFDAPVSLDAPDATWVAATRATPVGDLRQATVTRIQSVDEFHSFFPMEVIANKAETAQFMQAAPNGWMVVPEHRDYPVRMRKYLPKSWTDRGPSTTFQSIVLRDEFFTFQVAVVAGSRALSDIAVAFEGFPESWQETLTCFNCGGIDENGIPFEKEVNVAAETIQPLWLGVQVPADQRPGLVEGAVVVSAGAERKTISVKVTVDDAAVANHGFDEPELMSRLAWLDSTAGTDPDFIIQPYTPVEIGGANGHDLSILGRTVALGASGLPDRIVSYFTPEMTSLADQPQPILATPVALNIVIGGVTERLSAEPFQVTQEARGRVSWSADSRSDRVRMSVRGALEYDGMLDYRIAVEALEELNIDDIVLPLALVPDAAEYMLGLGRKGGRTPAQIDWTWKVENHQEGAWFGGINKGLQYVLRDDNYARPLNTNFYLNQPLNMPPSWFNDGRGGIRIARTAGSVTATNYSGKRQMSAGATLHFNVRFLVTPFKTLDTKTHFDTRFVHKYVTVDEVKAAGGTVVNIHHANEINPYINYPFYALDKQTAYIE
ncbi:MAG: hypothetical protein HQ485_00495, partial [Acidobacteria bacterium]|nr:hypothetical protein [Acidobacteriota bacterium]